jgi:hypothetical protein
MSRTEHLSFEESVDLLRERLGAADAANPSEIHSFKELMDNDPSVGAIPDVWYWEAFDELEAQGHLDPRASMRLNGGDAAARLSADGRLYVRSTGD